MAYPDDKGSQLDVLLVRLKGLIGNLGKNEEIDSNFLNKMDYLMIMGILTNLNYNDLVEKAGENIAAKLVYTNATAYEKPSLGETQKLLLEEIRTLVISKNC